MSPPCTSVSAIDPSILPKHFESAEVEQRWDQIWEQWGITRWDPDRPRGETFVVDTPPPTVSGSLHVGHIFSYVHTDVQVRYQRMNGQNIFYPMGWDDNGVPTERRVQNVFHVRCDPKAPYEAGLELAPASAKQRKQPVRLLSRQNFIELCHLLTAEDEKAFKTLWRRTGLSVDWSLEYATIDDRCRRLSQYSFLDLFEKGHVYSQHAPFMWDVDFHMAVAQAEIEDRMKPGAFHHIEFGVEDSGRTFVVATTRPELLAACVGVTAHPGDDRYRDLFGKHAVTPLFRVPVPIFPSELADPEKGTGILMVCTFGDATDVDWWRQEGLALRQLIGRNGRLVDVEFGSEDFPSLDAEAANRYYGEIAGKNVGGARKAIVDLLRDPAASATGNDAPLQGEPRPVEHAVRFYEKGDRPLEILPTRQWFVRLLDKKESLLAQGDAIQWHPTHMRTRYRDWTEGLQLDWCISRQRYFGVPIPVWYALDENGERDYERPILPTPDALPIDPMTDLPPDFDESRRDKPGGFTGEADIFDTWFTSSLTPQIGSHWSLDPGRHAKLFPADVRPQSHEIIRTWAFYTIVKALLHDDAIPWQHVVVSGWVLDPDRKKMSKSAGNVLTPMPLIEKFGADAARYWSASARLGTDTAFDEQVLKIGKRLVTKLFNAGKFVLSQSADVQPISSELDLAFVHQLRQLVDRATRCFQEFNFAHALQETETFFWTRFTDTFLELSKPRARAEGSDAAAARGSAVAALRLGLDVLLRLFAPALPYVTEEVWSWCFAKEGGRNPALPGSDGPPPASIHRSAWPSAGDFAGIPEPIHAESFDVAVACWTAINKAKADASVSVAREVESLVIAARAEALASLEPVLADVIAAARVERYALREDPSLEERGFAVQEIRFAERPDPA